MTRYISNTVTGTLMSNTEEPTTTGLEDVWYLKEILWSIEPHVPKKHVKIITQNFNGLRFLLCLRYHLIVFFNIKVHVLSSPYVSDILNGLVKCSNTPSGNILILRDQIHLEPAGRVSVSYEYLSNIVAEYLLSSPSESDPASALSILPVTRSRYP